MKTIDRLIRAFRNPRLFARGLNRTYHRLGGLRSENAEGVDVFNEDWDTLVVLDACRFDMFEQVNHIEGRLTAKTSKASSTTEWLRANVDGGDLRDTVYVTANPQLARNQENWDVNFHEVVNVWLDEGWDEETGTVLAETMTRAAIAAHDDFPQKRLVVHYMQPHYPFVPSDATFDKNHLNQIGSDGESPEGENVWNKKFTGELSLSQDDLWSMYTENLAYALEHVADLLENVSGKTVVTADHGNYVGERASPIPIREYGHSRGLYDDPVVRVPWLEYERGERRQISTGTTDEINSAVEAKVVDDRLRDLGYRT